ncbi:adenylate/guanylate cyclase domain-containing protein [Candidatus Albibeggiatoa sp. nov. BB20]|uniref:adenylate/guanylate cyclase domain-containing protein n=1 Tax=Candidatus Albibeggiatoa sp. nov. BB20 TaxID=3162723 RepID=UPI0033654969
MDDKTAEQQIHKLNKQVLLYQKKLRRSEINRTQLETLKEKSDHLLKTINTEVETVRKTIETKNQQLEQLYQELQHEQLKSENLLLNILPSKIATELKQTGKVEPFYIESVTVLFTDFKGFTKIAATISPQELIQELDYCFSNFDNIIEKHHLERLKTIGDAYMCAAGLCGRETHCLDTVHAALEIGEFMQHYIQTKKQQNKPYWDIRIGLHTGSVVAGVVGEKKFAYDIWGDTVNIASRMESASEAGKINISKDSHELVKEHFAFEYRGKIAIKNCGELEMFFVSEKS